MDEQMSVRLIEALARVWTRIRVLHPGVPPVVVLAAPAPRGEMNVLGHFAALRWSGKHQGDTHLHEVVVVAEHLNRSAADTVETLLHEAAHSMNFEKKIADCSRSQYHNAHFRDAAVEVGLDVQRVKHYGYALTTMPTATAERYQLEIWALESVLIHRRKPVALAATGPPGTTSGGDDEDGDQKPTSRLRKATCACGHIIRISMKTYLGTTIRCESCGEAFQLS